jgi:hypothetical protein
MYEMEMNTAQDTLYFIDAKYPQFSSGGYMSYNIDSNGVLSNFKRGGYHDTALKSNSVLSPDGRYIINGTGKIFNTSFKYIAKLNKAFYGVAFDEDNGKIYAGVDESVIYAYDSTSFKSVNSYKVKGKPVKVFYKDGKVAAVTYIGGRYYMESFSVN